MNRKAVAGLLATVMALGCLCGCKDKEKTTSPESSASTPESNGVKTVYSSEVYGWQMGEPQKGDTVAILHTDMGDISVRFFPEAAPKAVENFITHAKNGYYNGLTFHRIVSDFMIQGGDPTGTGSAGESIWGKDFEDEFDSNLLNLRGALSMANSGVNTNGSQFFINQRKSEGTAEELKKMYDYDAIYSQYKTAFEQYKQYYGDAFTQYYKDVDAYIASVGGISPNSKMVPDEVWEVYAKYGGNINLDGAWRKSGGHTVFGQVYDGMDIVDAIAAVETDSNSKPVKDVCIKTIEITEY